MLFITRTSDFCLTPLTNLCQAIYRGYIMKSISLCHHFHQDLNKNPFPSSGRQTHQCRFEGLLPLGKDKDWGERDGKLGCHLGIQNEQVCKGKENATHGQ